jgi:hypothetical protein
MAGESGYAIVDYKLHSKSWNGRAMPVAPHKFLSTGCCWFARSWGEHNQHRIRREGAQEGEARMMRKKR